MMADVVALGELLVDFTWVSADPAGYPTLAAHPGGAPANYLAALANCGISTALLGKVGDDAFGHLLRSTLDRAGIDTGGLILTRDAFTTLAFVTLDSAGDRSFSFARKPGADTCLAWEEVDRDRIDGARVFHFGSLSLTQEPARTATYQAVAYARQRGKLISYDPNLRLALWENPDQCRAQMLWGLEQADVVKLSREEVEFLFGLGVEDGARHLLDRYGVRLVFVTCGAQGAYFANAKARGMVPGLGNLPVVDTTGAGDIFGGSVMGRLLASGKAPENLNEGELRAITAFGCMVAGISTTASGGISSVPQPETIQALLEQQGGI